MQDREIRRHEKRHEPMDAREATDTAHANRRGYIDSYLQNCERPIEAARWGEHETCQQRAEERERHQPSAQLVAEQLPGGQTVPERVQQRQMP